MPKVSQKTRRLIITQTFIDAILKTKGWDTDSIDWHSQHLDHMAVHILAYIDDEAENLGDRDDDPLPC